MSTSNPSRILTLFYWILNVSKSSSSVDIEDYRSVDYLRKEILKANPVGLAHVDASDLLLWNVSIPVTKKLNESVSTYQFHSESALLEVDLLSNTFPPPQPLERTLHIVVQSQCSSTLKRSSEVQPADEVSKKRLKAFSELSEEELQAMNKVYEQIYKLSQEPTEYSDPNKLFDLPFPSTNDIPRRFSLLHEGSFSYMGREGFNKVLDALRNVQGNLRQRQAVYIYGSKGYGKSYILAALACHLVGIGTQVVYIPDCHACLLDPLNYLLTAITFAFVKSEPSFLQEILECENIESLANFCARYRKSGQLYFIIDQLNALDPELMTQDIVPNADKVFLRQLLNRMSARHVLITSASANHKTFQYMMDRDTGERKVPLMGGMTSSEMPFWWKHHNFVAFSDADKQRVEDLTGSIPLLLKPFLMHRTKTLASLEPQIWSDEALESVRRQTIGFANAKKLELQHPTAFRDSFVTLMRNFLLGAQIFAPGLYMDHRYFYVNSDGYGSYSCGLARQALTEFLRTNAEESFFLGPEWYNTLIAFRHNLSVVGFTVEQMVISKIASLGLLLANLYLPAAPIHPFDNPTARLSIDKPATYYVPIRFNLKAIDLLFASIDAKTKTAHIVPIQITVAKQHKDSEGAFFADKATWLRGLEGFKVEMTFLWIHKGKRGQKAVQEKLRELRGTSKKINPDYTVYWVDISQIDVELSKTLTQIKLS